MTDKPKSRLSQLNRTPGNIKPTTSYEEKAKNNLQTVAQNIQKKELKKEKKVNNQKNSFKYGDDTRARLEAQKQIEGIKFDYEMLDLLLERNANNFSQKDKAKYAILIDE